MNDIAISAENLGKSYRLGQRSGGLFRYKSLREMIASPFKRSHASTLPRSDETFWALKDVSFEIKRGEVVGIIGRNGAGKSTLLKILSRITEPTEGFADIYGRIGSLLEVGTGFHPELTGRENIFLNGVILGMRKSEIVRRFDEIVAFAEVEKFLDTPVKHYSSGMYVRLAFAVAAHLEPEILLVDEVLAVGDAAFQKKCLGKMSDVAKQGRTILFVSHNMGAISSICSRAIYFAEGKVRMDDRADKVVATYLGESFDSDTGDLESFRVTGMGDEVRMSRIESSAKDGKSFAFGEPLEFRLLVEADVASEELSIGCSIFTASGVCVGTLFTEQLFSVMSGDKLRLRLMVPHLNLAPGRYRAGFSIGHGGKNSARHDLDIIIGHPSFQIVPTSQLGELAFGWGPQWGSIVIAHSKLLIERD